MMSVGRRLARFGALGAAFCAMLAGGGAAAGQQRPAVLERALAELDQAERVRLLGVVANPELGPPDTAWALGVHLLAQTLLDEGLETEAHTWLRWLARRSGGAPPDTRLVLPSVVTAYAEAVTAVRGLPAWPDSRVRSWWIWPEPVPMTGTGSILHTPGWRDGRVTVAGDPLEPGAPRTLPPGTYDLTVSADDLEEAVQVEVLPGVTTTVEIDPLSPLRGSGERAARGGLVQIRDGSGRCLGGVLVRRELLVTLDSELPEKAKLAVRPAGTPQDVSEPRFAGSDEKQDLAVFYVKLSGSPLEIGSPRRGLDAWALVVRCGEVDVIPTRIGAVRDGVWTLMRSVDPGGGGAVVDRTGALLGLLVDGSTMRSVDGLEGLLARVGGG